MTNRVLFVTDNYPPVFGGMARSAERIASYFPLWGYLVRTVSISQEGHNYPDNVISAERGAKDKETFHNLKQVVEYQILHWQPDLLVGFYINFSGYVVALLGKMYHIPSIISSRGNDLERGLFNPSRMSMVEYALRSCTHLTSVSQYLVNLALSINPQLSYTVVHNGIDLTALNYQYKPPSDRFCIGFFGDDRPKKGLDILVDAMDALSKLSEEKWKFVIGGKLSSKTRESLQKHQFGSMIKLNLKGKVDADQIDIFYSKIDLLVIPSRYDGLPNVLLEAVARRVPVLISDTPSLTEYFPETAVPTFDLEQPLSLVNRLQVLRKQDLSLQTNLAYDILKTRYSNLMEQKRWYQAIQSSLNQTS